MDAALVEYFDDLAIIVERFSPSFSKISEGTEHAFSNEHFMDFLHAFKKIYAQLKGPLLDEQELTIFAADAAVSLLDSVAQECQEDPLIVRPVFLKHVYDFYGFEYQEIASPAIGMLQFFSSSSSSSTASYRTITPTEEVLDTPESPTTSSDQGSSICCLM